MIGTASGSWYYTQSLCACGRYANLLIRLVVCIRLQSESIAMVQGILSSLQGVIGNGVPIVGADPKGRVSLIAFGYRVDTLKLRRCGPLKFYTLRLCTTALCGIDGTVQITIAYV
jgi:hypothetical protein